MKHNIDYFGLKTFYGGHPTPTPTPDTGSVTPIGQHIIIPDTKIDELFDDDTSDSSIYSIMRGATAQRDGSQGLVPMPRVGDQIKFLRGDGAWSIPTDPAYISTANNRPKLLTGSGNWTGLNELKRIPLQSHTYQNICAGFNYKDGAFYFIKIVLDPTKIDVTKPWDVAYILTIKIPSIKNSTTTMKVRIRGVNSTFHAIDIYNTCYGYDYSGGPLTSYSMPIIEHINRNYSSSEKSLYFGINFRNDNGPFSDLGNNSVNVTADLMGYQNCQASVEYLKIENVWSGGFPNVFGNNRLGHQSINFGNFTSGTPSQISPQGGNPGSSNDLARADHTHQLVVGTGDSNGQVKIGGANVSVKGLGDLAYKSTTGSATSSTYLRGDGQWVAPINDVTATSAGYVLDARVGKTLNDKFYTPIPSNTDLNTVTTPGFYAAISSAVASSLINCPTEYGFTMLVMQHGTTINQIIFGPGTVSAGIYMRTQTSTGFQPWFLIDSNTTSDFDVSDVEIPTYNSNSYASETSVKRIYFYKRTKWFGILYFNFTFDTALFPQSSNNVWLTIGHFNRLKPIHQILQVLCPQGSGSNNYGNLLLNVTSSGLINLYNSNTTPCGGWYRAEIPVIFN